MVITTAGVAGVVIITVGHVAGTAVGAKRNCTTALPLGVNRAGRGQERIDILPHLFHLVEAIQRNPTGQIRCSCYRIP